MMHRNHTSQLLTLLIVGFSTPSLAADDSLSAEVSAMGGAATANADDNSSITRNPALLPLVDSYTLQADLSLGASGALEWSLSAADAHTAPIGFGVTWRRTVAEPAFNDDELPGWTTAGVTPSNVKRRHEVTIGLGAPFLDRRLSVGINGTLRRAKDDRLNVPTSFSFDVGLAAAPVQGLTLGLAASRLVSTPDPMERVRDLRFGARYVLEGVAAMALDLGTPLQSTEGTPLFVGFGIEGFASILHPRLGYRYDGTSNAHRLTPGLGFENEAGSIDYAIQVPLAKGTRSSDLVHTLTLRVLVKAPER